MTDNQFLTEYFGECWHDWEWIERTGWKCQKCGLVAYGLEPPENPNYTTAQGFIDLWNKCKEQEWWENFIMTMITERDISGEHFHFLVNFVNWFIDPATFAKRVREFLEKEEI